MIKVAEAAARENNAAAGKKDAPSLWALMKEKSLETGVQGVPNIGRAQHRARRFFWILVVFTGTVLATWLVTAMTLKYYTYPESTEIERTRHTYAMLLSSAVLMTWQVTVSFMKYYKYPVKTQMLYRKDGQLVFPAVTICNLNPLRWSALSEADDMLDSFKKKSPTDDKKGKPAKFDDWTGAEDYESETTEFSAMQSYLTISAQLTPKQRRAVGHHLNTMLLSCTWNGISCSPKNFTWFSNHLYGNCFTFNSNNVNKSLIVSKPGPMYGLKLELYVEQDEYIDSLSDSAGIRIIIHNQTAMPFPEDVGFSVNPGSKTSVALSRVNVIRATPPHGSCVNKDSSQNEQVNAFLHEVPTINYTLAACRKTCYQTNLMKECGCFDSRYPSAPDIKAYANITNTTNLLPCRSEKAKAQGKGACEETMLSRFMKGQLGCDSLCPVECYHAQYSFSISQSDWPSTVKEEAVMEQLMDKSEYLWDLMDNKTDAWGMTYVRSNALKVEVYLKELDYQEIVTTPSYEVSDLLSDLGGQAGLWLGVSVIAIFEFVELLYDVISVAVVRQLSMCSGIRVSTVTKS